MAIGWIFELLFRSNAKDAQKDIADLEKSARKSTESLNSFGKANEEVGKSFLQLADSFKHAVVAALGASAIIGGLKHATEYAIEISQASKNLNISVADLDAWGNAVRRTGGTTEGFRHSLQSLAEHLGTTGNVALRVLPQLADVFSRVNRTAALQYGKSLGLDEATILLLQQGRREVESVLKRQKELGVVTDKDREIFLHFRDTINDTGHSFRTLFTTLATSAIPALSDLLEGTQKVVQYMTKHKDVLVGSFVAVAAAIGLMTAPVLATYAAVASLIALFGILFEDFKAFKEGRSSLIGDIQKKYGLHYRPENAPINESIRGFQANIREHLKEAIRSLIQSANDSPINNLANNSVLNSSAFNKNATINTGPITIMTQATDAVGISHDLRQELTKQWQYEETANYFADGKYA